MLQDTRILCTAVALPQAKPLSWLTLRLATLLVLSNTNPWRSPPPRAPTNSVRGFTLVIRSPCRGANNRLGPFVVAFRAVLEDRLPAGQQTDCDCLAAHGSSSRRHVPTPPMTNGRRWVYPRATMSGVSPRTPLGPVSGSRHLPFRLLLEPRSRTTARIQTPLSGRSGG
jgi:hypothetical protein